MAKQSKWSQIGPVSIQFETTMYEYQAEVNNGKLSAQCRSTTVAADSYSLPPEELPDNVAKAFATIMDYIANR